MSCASTPVRPGEEERSSPRARPARPGATTRSTQSRTTTPRSYAESQRKPSGSTRTKPEPAPRARVAVDPQRVARVRVPVDHDAPVGVEGGRAPVGVPQGLLHDRRRARALQPLPEVAHHRGAAGWPCRRPRPSPPGPSRAAPARPRPGCRPARARVRSGDQASRCSEVPSSSISRALPLDVVRVQERRSRGRRAAASTAASPVEVVPGDAELHDPVAAVARAGAGDVGLAAARQRPEHASPTSARSSSATRSRQALDPGPLPRRRATRPSPG